MTGDTVFYRFENGELVKVRRQRESFIKGPCQLFFGGEYIGVVDGLDAQVEEIEQVGNDGGAE